MTTDKPAARVRRPPRSIQASTFKATCLKLMDEVANTRAEFVVTKHGRPMVKVGPADEPPPSPFGFLRNTVAGHMSLVGPDHAAWRPSSSDPLDARKR